VKNRRHYFKGECYILTKGKVMKRENFFDSYFCQSFLALTLYRPNYVLNCVGATSQQKRISEVIQCRCVNVKQETFPFFLPKHDKKQGPLLNCYTRWSSRLEYSLKGEDIFSTIRN